MENIRKEQYYRKPIVYALWSKNDEIRFNSTSGGAFSEFAQIILSKKGFVVGARYGNNHLVEHVMISDEYGLEDIRQSKYLSSNMGDIYKSVKNHLDEGRYIGFSGSPCQVAGLYSYLGKDYDNLITIDFICRGMN